MILFSYGRSFLESISYGYLSPFPSVIYEQCIKVKQFTGKMELYF